MADEKKESGRRISIESDGTFDGTTVMIDGKSIGGGSKKLDSVAFMAEGPFDANTQESFFRFRASTKEKDGDTERISTIRISNSADDDFAEVYDLQTRVSGTDDALAQVVVDTEGDDIVIEPKDKEEDKEEDKPPDEEEKKSDEDIDGDPEDDDKTEEPDAELTPWQRKQQARIQRIESILKG